MPNSMKGPGARTPSVVGSPHGRPAIGLGTYDIADLGYQLTEHFISGEANAYALVASDSDGDRWPVKIQQTAPYATRLVVASPLEPFRFNGTIVVEWLNVSGGFDTPVDWWTLHRELVRGGYVWVGVSAQSAGIEGSTSPFPVAQRPPSLKELDADRYGLLSHPGDAFAFDIYAQISRALRGPTAAGILGKLSPKRVLAIGESQSAMYLTTYVNAIAPLGDAFDGYLIHSRFGPAARLDGAPPLADPSILPQHVKLRDDLEKPVLVVNTETDVLGMNDLAGTWSTRQADTAMLRIWEIAGTAHADRYLSKVAAIDTGFAPVATLAEAYRPSTDFAGMTLDRPMNFNPAQHYVVQAALRHLDAWVKSGNPPPSAEPLCLGPGDPPTLVLDPFGNARGGLRTPWMDVPLARLTGSGNAGSAAAAGVGCGDPFDRSRLQQLYAGGRADYLDKFAGALDRTIEAGFLLRDDREEILELAAAAFDHAP